MKKIISISLLTSVLLTSVSACSHLQSYNVTGKKSVDTPQFNNNYRYKRMVINGTNEAWIASASLDDTYQAVDYYSADSGVITFNNSRLVAYSAPKPLRSWSEKTTPVSWNDIVKGTPKLIKRCIIDHPHNKVDHCQSRVLRLIDKAPKNNQLVSEFDVLWVQETPQSKYNYKKQKDIYYAIRKTDNKIMYGQLYLDDDTQITWQDWSF